LGIDTGDTGSCWGVSGHKAVFPMGCALAISCIDHDSQCIAQFVAKTHCDNCLISFELSTFTNCISNELGNSDHRQEEPGNDCQDSCDCSASE
jgi:hypothetical protein